MKQKVNYEAPEVSVLSFQLEGITNQSFRSAAKPSMTINEAQDEDWGDWE